MSDIYLMSANRVDIVNDKGWYVKISGLKKQFAWVNLTKYIATL